MGFGAWLSGLFGGGKEDAQGDVCVACDSTDLTVLAPGAYRCNTCGYEGGDGFAAYTHERELSSLRTKDLATVLGIATGHVTGAARTLLAAVGGSEDTTETGGTRWSFKLSVSLDDGGTFASMDAEERARIAAERQQGIDKAKGEVLLALPALETLNERNPSSLDEFVSTLQAWRDEEKTTAGAIAELIRELSQALEEFPLT